MSARVKNDSTTRSTGTPSDAFISYCRADDVLVASALQRGLQRIGKPWYRRWGMIVVRDQTDLDANPGLWESIFSKIDSSRFLILLARPSSAASPSVRRELCRWLSAGAVDREENFHAGVVDRARLSRLLLVLMAGHIAIEDARQRPNIARTDALPRLLAELYEDVPQWIDMRWASELSALDLTLQDPRFLESTARLAGSIHKRSPAEIMVGYQRDRRRTLRLAWSIAALLAGLSLTVTVLWGSLQNRSNRLQDELARMQWNRAREVRAEDELLAYHLFADAMAQARSRDVRDGIAFDASTVVPRYQLARVAQGTGIFTGVTWLPGGDSLLTWSADSTVSVWRITGDSLPRVVVKLRGPAAGAAVSPDGKHAWAWDDSGRVSEAVLGTGHRHTGPYALGGPIRALVQDTSGTRIGVVLSSTALLNYSTFSIVAMDVDSVLVREEMPVRQIAYNASADCVLVLCDDGILHAFEAQSGRRVGVWRWSGSRLSHIPRYGLGLNAFVALLRVAPTVEEVKATAAARYSSLLPRGAVDGAFSIDGSHLLTWQSQSGHVASWLWTISRNGIESHPWRRGASWSDARFAPGGKAILTESGAGSRVWQIDGTAAGVPTPGAEVLGVDCGGARLLIRSTDRDLVEVWDTGWGRRLGQIATDAFFGSEVSLSCDGRRVAVVSSNKIGVYECAMESSILSRLATGTVGSTISDAGDLGAGWDSSGHVTCWDLRRGQRLPTFAHRAAILGAAFNHDERFLLTWSRDGTARIWDVRRRRAAGPPLTHRGPVVGAVFERGHECVLTWSTDSTAVLWSTNGGVASGRTFRHGARVKGAELRENGHELIAWGTDSTISYWPLRPAAASRQSCRVPGLILSAHWMSSGDVEVEFLTDRLVEYAVWHPGTHEVRRTFGAVDEGTDGDQLDVVGGKVEFRTRDGKRAGPAIASTSEIIGAERILGGRLVVGWTADSTLRFWEVRTGWAIGPSLALPSAILSTDISKTRNRALIRCRDGSLWKVDLPGAFDGPADALRLRAQISTGVRLDLTTGELVPLVDDYSSESLPDVWRRLVARAQRRGRPDHEWAAEGR